MDKMRLILFAVGLALAACGCWTFNETDYPATRIESAPTNTTVAVVGFDAQMTEYVAVTGFSTFYVSGYYGHCHAHPGFYETVPTSTVVAQKQRTDAFLRRAKNIFESAGYIIAAATPRWTVEVEFEGPVSTSEDVSYKALWMIGTLFFCDYDAAACTARLKVRDNATGALVFHREYSQKYETHVFGLIPVFGISSCDKTSESYLHGWCLAALTDRAVADAAAYLRSAAAKTAP